MLLGLQSCVQRVQGIAHENPNEEFQWFASLLVFLHVGLVCRIFGGLCLSFVSIHVGKL